MRKADIMLLAAWVVVPPVLVLLLHGNFFLSIVLYLVVPSIYFSIRRPQIIPRALVVATATMPVMIVLDYMAFLNNAWMVPTIFPVRYFEFIPVEDFFFTFAAMYTVVAGFNYFFPHLRFADMHIPRLKFTVSIVFITFAVFLLFYVSAPQMLFIPYFYAWLILCAFIFPAVFLFIGFPTYRKPFLYIISFSIVLMLPYEIVANVLGFWTFPGQYLGMLRIAGQSFPIEEFLAWMVFFPPSAIAFSKFMTDKT